MDVDINGKFYYSIGLITKWTSGPHILTNIWDMSLSFSNINNQALNYLINYIHNSDWDTKFGFKIIKSNENEYMSFNYSEFRNNVVEILNSILVMEKLVE